MTTQLIIPPAHVWDRIEKILDQKDIERKHTKKLIYSSFRRSRNIRRLNFFFVLMTGVSLLAFMMRNYSAGLKKN